MKKVTSVSDNHYYFILFLAPPAISQPNPILALQKAVEGDQKKDGHKQPPPPPLVPEGNHRVQMTVAGPPQPVSSAPVHVGIVQGKAHTLSHRETSPPGQVSHVSFDFLLFHSTTFHLFSTIWIDITVPFFNINLILFLQVITKVPNPMARALLVSTASGQPVVRPSVSGHDSRIPTGPMPVRQTSPQTAREHQGKIATVKIQFIISVRNS